MNLVTIYSALIKKAAAGPMPSSPLGGMFKQKPLPPPISAPGAQPPEPPPEQAAQADPSMTPDKSMQMLEKGWEKTMDTMKQMTAMNNGIPVEESGAQATTQATTPAPGLPGQPPMPSDGMPPQPLPKMATIYNSMKKRAEDLDFSATDPLNVPPPWYARVSPKAMLAGLGAAGAASVIPAAGVPGHSIGSLALQNGIANGTVPVIGAAGYAADSISKKNDKLNTAAENQLRAAQNAADNNARWMQKRYNEWRKSRGMEPINYPDPVTWRNKPREGRIVIKGS